jgi:cell wall-associated NlpC family hydrolase
VGLIGVFAPPGSVGADAVDDQRRKVQQIADQLDAIANRAQQLDDQYSAAVAQHDQLAAEIVDAQARVDAQQSELQRLQGTLAAIAIDKYVNGGRFALSPVFSSAQAYSEATQRDELTRLALDNGAGDTDQLQSLVDSLAAQRASLAAKTERAAQLLTYLDAKRSAASQLEAEYGVRYQAAQAELGAALEREQERRAAAAVAAAVRASSSSGGQGAATSPGRGGGATSGGTGSGGGATSGGTAPGTGSGTGPTVPAAPPPSGMAGVAIAAAYTQIGAPYVYAGESPGVGFDCSGLTKWAWGRAGVHLPHQSGMQYAALPHVPRDQVQPGDLIFYYSPISHVGIYVGNGQLVHAPNTGTTVTVANVNWAKVVGVARPG